LLESRVHHPESHVHRHYRESHALVQLFSTCRISAIMKHRVMMVFHTRLSRLHKISSRIWTRYSSLSFSGTWTTVASLLAIYEMTLQGFTELNIVLHMRMRYSAAAFHVPLLKKAISRWWTLHCHLLWLYCVTCYQPSISLQDLKMILFFVKS
jgi:hypothetical protein